MLSAYNYQDRVLEKMCDAHTMTQMTQLSPRQNDARTSNLLGALAGVEMGLALSGVPHRKGGVQAAMDYFAGGANPARAAAE